MLAIATALPGQASASRTPTGAEFHAIAAAVANNPQGAYYCASRSTTWVSSVRPTWALAQMLSNCGLGSQTVRFFLRRRDAGPGWRIAERHYERLGTGGGVPCGSRQVPGDIRCGPVRTRAASCRRVAEPPPSRRRFRAPKRVVAPGETLSAIVKTNCGAFQIALDASRAPLTVNSFTFLAERGFYDGLTFHRVVRHFVIQGGDPRGDGTGGPGYRVIEKPPADLAYTKGTVAMAKSAGEPRGASGSQFFVVTGADAGLPPEYALVGKVSEGLDVVERIGGLGTPSERPKQTVLIRSISIKRG